MSSFDELRERLAASGILSADAVEAQVAAWKAETGQSESGPPQAFLDWLTEKELISEFQADAVAAGHSGPLTLGPYRVYEQLAASRLGGIFRAVHEEFSQPVSLKVFPSAAAADPEKVARIGRELRVAVELDHPNVIRSYQLGKIGETYFLAMEDLRGETLEAKLEIEGSLPYKQACDIAQQVAEGLAHLHDNDVIHRDVRPATIWIAESGTAKLMDFGAARDAYSFLDTVGTGEGVTTSESILGEYDYMAPEQAKDARDADAMSDIYALGCTLYHCLTGHVPFEEKNLAKLVLKHASDFPEPVGSHVDGVPHQIDETIKGMMGKKPAERYQSANDVVRALEPFVDKSAAEAPPEIGEAVSQEYLDWARSSQPAEPEAMASEAVAVTPELIGFLDWMASRPTRRKRRRV